MDAAAQALLNLPAHNGHVQPVRSKSAGEGSNIVATGYYGAADHVVGAMRVRIAVGK